MKTRVFVVAALALVLLSTGCIGPYFRDQGEYDNGVWYGVADSREVARMKADKLAFEKLRAAPVQTEVKDDAPQGYKGLIANLSGYSRYNFTLVGPETKSFLLGPGERAIDYLVPGDYICIVYQGSYKVGVWRFKVGQQQSVFMNEKYHWYVYAER